MTYLQNVKLAFVDTYRKAFLRLLSVIFRYFLLLNQLRAGDIFVRRTGQQGYKIYMYMPYRKEMQHSVHFIFENRTRRLGMASKCRAVRKQVFSQKVIQRQLTRQATTYANINNDVTGILTARKRLILALFRYYLLC